MEIKDLKLTPKRKEILDRLSLYSIKDIVSYYPFKYEEHRITHYNDFKVGENVFFEGELSSYPSTFRYAGKKSITRFKVIYEEEELNISIFNRPWIRNLNYNSKIVIIGKYDGGNKITASNYYTKPIEEIEGIMPLYSLKEGISQNDIKKIIELVLNKCELIDEMPSEYIDKHHLISYEEAIRNIHKPKDHLMLMKALSRLKYEEFLRFHLALIYQSSNVLNNDKPIKTIDKEKINAFIKSFDYSFTSDQTKACEDIINDISSTKTMYRLLQGDVGSGKTAVSMVGCYGNYLAGYQSALLAPTEILARQHYKSFIEAFKNTNCRIEVLYSNCPNMEEIKQRLKDGDIDIIIGTHALIQEDVTFNKLGLVVSDEQHRFGVNQRKALNEKGKDADVLMMSATPIPRTLANSIYSDMSVSNIVTMPNGRKGVDTYLINENSIVSVIDKIKEKLKEGRQAYIIAAAIEASDNYKAKDASGLHNALIDAFVPYKVGLLHGRMSSEEKDNIMSSFNNNDIQVLVSTTVVEVGVNVKNATVMVIYDSERFGMSQIHQLRGRIQRGSYKGTCYLLTSTKEMEALNRLNILVNCNDGFKIAYEDLKLRGPGDILGTRQSGLPGFILGNLIEDTKFIDAAKDDAQQISKNLDKKDNKVFFDKIIHESKNSIRD